MTWVVVVVMMKTINSLQDNQQKNRQARWDQVTFWMFVCGQEVGGVEGFHTLVLQTYPEGIRRSALCEAEILSVVNLLAKVLTASSMITKTNVLSSSSCV